ncbi:pyridoxal 5'-phosphate synthase glutaminase subunit PdxT [Peribacillus sp. NPDC097197]|uniref:pyridoxal 5'-phosphate synthase glutaminase subunit PdxT n=1 Tax=Peribacillus sp. NPDC097197 TaxID=3390615 RepID=UPI003D065C6B
MVTIGVLGLQGAVDEHMNQIKEAGEHAILVKNPEQLKDIDGLIIPGGESTTMRKLMDHYGFMEPITAFFEQKKPIFGTCAGMVLVAKEMVCLEHPHLGFINITVNRNGFGRQRESFQAPLIVKGMEEPFMGVFIRAPFAVGVGEDVEILASYDGKVVAARQEQVLVSSFHPELTGDQRFIQLFLKMVKDSINRVEKL